ncbi:MAG TPA: hypothetical protein VFZ36_03945 [Vicinamibacterales bacterium]
MRGVPLIALLTLALAGCAKARAEMPAPVALEVPPVPPRVIVPDIEEVALSPETADPARAAAPRPDAPPKPPEKPADPPKTGTQEPPKVEEPPRVRQPAMASNEEADRAVRAIMARAQSLLGGVDYRALSAAARQQYDTARRFITQADNALKIRNYVFARNLADKAETLARQLGK